MTMTTILVGCCFTTVGRFRPARASSYRRLQRMCIPSRRRPKTGKRCLNPWQVLSIVNTRGLSDPRTPANELSLRYTLDSGFRALSMRVLTVHVLLGVMLLVHCKQGAGEERGPQGSEGKPLVVDLRSPPRAAPPATAFDMNNIPAGPSTAEERERTIGGRRKPKTSPCASS